MMSFVILVMTIAPLLAPMIGGALLLWFSWHAIFWTMGAAALIGSLLVALFIKETLPKERRQRFHLRTTLGNFGSLFRHKRVLSYMLASAFSFAGMFSFLSAGPFVYIELNHVSPQHFGYYFALNIVFLFLTTLINSRNVRRFGAVKMFAGAVGTAGDGAVAGGGERRRPGLLGAGDRRCGLSGVHLDDLLQRHGGDPG